MGHLSTDSKTDSRIETDVRRFLGGIITKNMELPNKSHAYVSTRKIADYLLSETHAVGKSKPSFFGRLVLTKQMSVCLSMGLSILPKQNRLPNPPKRFTAKNM